jgi:KDO2-lipid IV(A) lauroyltransferase
MFPKGAEGARGALRHLLAGGVLAMLVDQKMNDGIAATLFGHRAMTASAGAALALRFRCKLLPAHAERLGPARLRIVVEAPLPLPDSGDRAADVTALTQAMNGCVERWIAARPAEWLWLHRRWPKELQT